MEKARCTKPLCASDKVIVARNVSLPISYKEWACKGYAIKTEEQITGQKDRQSIQDIDITNCSKSKLTLRAVLYCTRCGASGAEFVDHSCDILHPSVHHSLHVIHVEQVEPLQTTLQSWDLNPGIAQAGWHLIQLHLERPKREQRKLFLAQATKQVDYWRHRPHSLFHLPVWILTLKQCLRAGWLAAKVTMRVNKLIRQPKFTAIWLVSTADSPPCLKNQEFSLVDWCQVRLQRFFNIWSLYIPPGRIWLSKFDIKLYLKHFKTYLMATCFDHCPEHFHRGY